MTDQQQLQQLLQMQDGGSGVGLVSLDGGHAGTLAAAAAVDEPEAGGGSLVMQQDLQQVRKSCCSRVARSLSA